MRGPPTVARRSMHWQPCGGQSRGSTAVRCACWQWRSTTRATQRGRSATSSQARVTQLQPTSDKRIARCLSVHGWQCFSLNIVKAPGNACSLSAFVFLVHSSHSTLPPLPPTGQERRLVDGASHTACTVEMVNLQRRVDVAVVDEVQMMADAARGWAWTRALVSALSLFGMNSSCPIWVMGEHIEQ
jgi:hypothetical protein